MKSFLRSAFVLSLFAVMIWSQVSFAGFVEGTKVSTAAEQLPIELLEEGDYVVTQGVNICATTKIIGTHAEKQNNVVVIRTALGTFCSSPEQLFYDAMQDDFVPACELNLSSLLVTRSLTQYRCEAVELFAIPAIMHDLSLEEPHVFFVGQGEFLTHNAYAPAVGAAVLGFSIAPLPVVLVAGTIIAAVAYNAAVPRILGKAATAKTEIEKEVQRFVDKYRSSKEVLMRGVKAEPRVHVPSTPPPLFDVFIDAKRYLDLIKWPLTYGQIYAALNVNADCEVSCQLFAQHFKEIDYRTNKLFFDWVVLGQAKLPYHNPLSKAALAEEDNARMAELREYVKSLPASVTKRMFNPRVSVEVEAEGIKIEEGCFDGTLYQKIFGPHAICKIVRQNIPPSAIICALRQGTRKPAKRDGLLICFDQKLNVVLVLDKVSGKVVNLGHYSEMNALDQEKRKVKTVDDILREAEPEERDNPRKKERETKIFGKHKGSFEEALEDFYSLNPANIFDKDEVKIGYLSDGRTVIFRNESSDKRPTLEIQRQSLAGGKVSEVKIRYGAKPNHGNKDVKKQ